ncbi:hypothetical protein [Novosphingobium sp. PhB55]|uniref:hypothetical protein n=1 Tax=Novosphingobium sp. PhB55 TaxID=2485106 RepID=UPI0014170AB5|nr:hypothetical protein [Novosphingobium sp. PhB55]
MKAFSDLQTVHAPISERRRHAGLPKGERINRSGKSAVFQKVNGPLEVAFHAQSGCAFT